MVRGGAGSSLSRVFNQIKEVQKKFKTRELEKKELEVGKGLMEEAGEGLMIDFCIELMIEVC